MALSEIPKLYLAGLGSHHSAPHNLLINCKKEKKPTVSPTPSTARKEGHGRRKGRKAKLGVLGGCDIVGGGGRGTADFLERADGWAFFHSPLVAFIGIDFSVIE